MVIGSLVLWLSPCWQRMSLHTKCNVALLQGQVNLTLYELVDRYTFSVFYETCWDAWVQKNFNDSDDAVNGVISNLEQR